MPQRPGWRLVGRNPCEPSGTRGNLGNTMADDVYPADLPTQLAAILGNAHSLDVRRAGRGRKPGLHVDRIALTHAGVAVKHGTRSDATDEDVASLVWAAASADANAKCNGAQLYKVTASYAKPKTGPAPDARSIDLQVGDADDEDEQQQQRRQRSDAFAECLADKRAIFGELMKTLGECRKMAESMSTMAIGLVGAQAAVTDRERANAQASLEAKFIESEQAGERERMKMLQTFLVPALGMLQAKLGIAPAPIAGDAKHSELVRASRAFVGSLTGAQREEIKRKLGSTVLDALDKLREVDDDPAAMLELLKFYSAPQSAIVDVYMQLDAQQQATATRLQELVTAAADANR